jgi:deoxyribonuclease V
MMCWEKLKTKPDLVVVDGHGIAHPRRLGIAAHFGLVIDTPTMGAAKNLLYGKYDAPGIKAGSFSYIVDPKTGENIGAALRTKDKVKEMLISPGHLNTVEDALAMARTLVHKHRLTEPTRFAHNLVNSFRIGETKEGYYKYPAKDSLF